MPGITKDIKVHDGKAESKVMSQRRGGVLSWSLADGVIELALHREPCNELGSATLDELENFAAALESMQAEAHSLIIYSEMKPGFCAGADLRELISARRRWRKLRLPKVCGIFCSGFTAC